MPKFVTRIPTSGGDGSTLPVSVRQITLRPDRGMDAWIDRIEPEIARDPLRPDAQWKWSRIKYLTLLGGGLLGGRLYQMTIGDPPRPAAMIALLTDECWFSDSSEPATFLWYLSTAPSRLLQFGRHGAEPVRPKGVGQAAFDVALTLALEAAGQGRLWLHASPEGGDALMKWYTQTLRMGIIEPSRHPRLPGNTFLGGRLNDGRYLYLDKAAALGAWQNLSWQRK